LAVRQQPAHDSATSGFTHDDPIEDTETTESPEQIIVKINASPTTIRLRILKQHR
jgi:hypothetical protein